MILVSTVDLCNWSIKKVGLYWESWEQLTNFVNSQGVFCKFNVLGMAPKPEVFNESFNFKNNTD